LRVNYSGDDVRLLCGTAAMPLMQWLTLTLASNQGDKRR